MVTYLYKQLKSEIVHIQYNFIYLTMGIFLNDKFYFSHDLFRYSVTNPHRTNSGDVCTNTNAAYELVERYGVGGMAKSRGGTSGKQQGGSTKWRGEAKRGGRGGGGATSSEGDGGDEEVYEPIPGCQ